MNITKLFLTTLLFGLMAVTALAAPAGPRSLNMTSDERLLPYANQNMTAIAGNVSELIFNVWSVTRTWQGYYGNITGTIVLSDQSNNTLYDWNNANPNGRIYATRKSQTPDWPSIRCANDSELDDQEAQFSGTNETDRSGIYPVDRPNATFVKNIFPTDYNQTGNNAKSGMYANYSTFWVGNITIYGSIDTDGVTPLAGQCFSTVMHNNAAWEDNNQNAQNDPNHWREVLLSDGSVNGTIYTALLEVNDPKGFDNRSHDFQMIVPENGHGTDTDVSTYFFYVELE